MSIALGTFWPTRGDEGPGVAGTVERATSPGAPDHSYAELLRAETSMSESPNPSRRIGRGAKGAGDFELDGSEPWSFHPSDTFRATYMLIAPSTPATRLHHSAKSPFPHPAPVEAM